MANLTFKIGSVVARMSRKSISNGKLKLEPNVKTMNFKFTINYIFVSNYFYGFREIL